MNKRDVAIALFEEGFNCAQAVAAAFCDEAGVSKETMVKMASGFGGGFGRLREVCGAVSGMFMLAGLKYGKGIPNDLETRTKVYDTVQKMAKEFETMNGSIVCGDLLGINKPKDTGAVPTERNSEFYKKRPCVGCVEDCAKIVEKYLLD